MRTHSLQVVHQHHHHHHQAVEPAAHEDVDVPFMEPHAAEHNDVHHHPEHDNESNDVHIPTPSPQPLHDEEHELQPLPDRPEPQAASSHEVPDVHFEMCPWPSVSGVSFNNHSFHYLPGHAYGEQEQHDFQPKMRAMQRKESARFCSISNRHRQGWCTCLNVFAHC